MDIKDMKGNECSPPDQDNEPGGERLDWLGVSDAIHHLEDIVSELEKALRINKK